MIGFQPPRPVGTDHKTRFDQWVWDCLVNLLRPQEGRGAKSVRTTRGHYPITDQTSGPGSAPGQVFPFWL